MGLKGQPNTLADPHLAVEVAAGMLAATTFHERFAVVQNTLIGLGATSINVATLCAQNQVPLWFYSSLPDHVLAEYVDQGFLAHDFIVQHAATSPAPYVWETDMPAAAEQTQDSQRFGDFVRGSGERVINCQTLHGARAGQVRAITYCSKHHPRDILAKESAARIDMALRLMLPWMDWPEDPSGPGFLPLPQMLLAPRETEALRLLAGGLKNARIAEAMGVTEATVAKHLIAARHKLGARTREEAIALAAKRRMLDA